MLTPNGLPADKIEKVMLLSMWANVVNDENINLKKEDKKFIFAGLGKPTYPINPHTIESYLSYWKNKQTSAEAWHQNPEEEIENSAIDYGDPRGDTKARTIMAEAMSEWYDTAVLPENVLFTVGGIGALRIIFETLNTFYAEPYGFRIITPFPHYSAYSNNPHHHLHPVDVMNTPGYKLTASALEESIKEAYRLGEIDNGYPRAVLICNPSNPLGNIVDEQEMIKIAEVLRRYPKLHLIFDEAYAEMCYEKMPSFLKIAPDLKSRTIILRSATKALSAAGERMAIMLSFDPNMMNEMLNKNISYFVHAPRSAQMAYAQTMAHFTKEDQDKMSAFYKKKVDFVLERLAKMGASMPSSSYKVEATFYAMGDFSDFLGCNLSPCAERALQKNGEIKSGEDIAYYLLFKEKIMITPLSYFGLGDDCGYMRITCSAKPSELKEMMDRLECCLLVARASKKKNLLTVLENTLDTLKLTHPSMHTVMCEKLASLKMQEETCLTLKQHIDQLDAYESLVGEILNDVSICPDKVVAMAQELSA